MRDALVCLVVDASGSMSMSPDGKIPAPSGGSRRDQTIKGINSFLRDQKGNPAKTYVSVTLFNTAAKAPFVGHDVRELPDLGSSGLPYVCGGGTALYDAIGATIKGAELWLKNHKDFDGQVAVVIGTDGEENSSLVWHAFPGADVEDDKDINNLIKYKQAEGWEFVFLGAGPDAWSQSQQLVSVAAVDGGTFNYDANDISSSYEGMSQSFMASRSTGTSLLANTSSNAVLRSISKEDPEVSPEK